MGNVSNHNNHATMVSFTQTETRKTEDHTCLSYSNVYPEVFDLEETYRSQLRQLPSRTGCNEMMHNEKELQRPNYSMKKVVSHEWLTMGNASKYTKRTIGISSRLRSYRSQNRC